MNDKIDIKKDTDSNVVLHDSDVVRDIIVERETLRAWLASLPPLEEQRWQDYLWQD